MFKKTPVSASQPSGSHWLPKASALLLWTGAAASAAAWGLAFWPADPRPLAPSVGLQVTQPVALQAADIGKVLGLSSASETSLSPAAPEISSRLALIGIAKSGVNQSVALIAVDGQAAKPFARGTEVVPGLLLQTVTLQQAQLGARIDGPAQLQLSMPVRPEPATGVLASKP